MPAESHGSVSGRVTGSASVGSRTDVDRSSRGSTRGRRRAAGSASTSARDSTRAPPRPRLRSTAFCDLFLARHGATVAARTRRTLEQRLAPARAVFGDWTLRELEHAAGDVARWRAGLADSSRYRLTSALRQALAAAVRWQYVARNPAVDAGRNPLPATEELRPFTRDEVDALAQELGPIYGPLVVFAAETGLRTHELVALERRDVDRADRVVTVQRRYADGVLTPYPKTKRSRRRVPLTARAEAALDSLPPRLDSPLVFPARAARRIPAPRQLADAGLVPGARRRRDRAARPVCAPSHVRNRGTRGRHLRL